MQWRYLAGGPPTSDHVRWSTRMSDPDPNDDDRDRDVDSERRSGAGSTPSNVVDLDINVGIGPLTKLLGGVIDVSTASPSDRGEWQVVDESEGADRDASSHRSFPDTEPAIDFEDEYLVDTHRTDDEFVVTAELPGVSEDDLSVGIDVRSNEFVIAADGRSIERIALPWSSTVAAKVLFNNGVLEVRLKPADDDEGEADRDDGS